MKRKAWRYQKGIFGEQKIEQRIIALKRIQISFTDQSHQIERKSRSGTLAYKINQKYGVIE